MIFFVVVDFGTRGADVLFFNALHGCDTESSYVLLFSVAEGNKSEISFPKLLPPAYAVEVMFSSCLCVCLCMCVCVCVCSGYNF